MKTCQPPTSHLKIASRQDLEAVHAQQRAWTVQVLQKHFTPEPFELSRVVLSIFDAMSHAFAEHTASPGRTATPGQPPLIVLSCHKGCSACCHIHVECLVIEVVAILLGLRETRMTEAQRQVQRETLQSRAAAQALQIQGKSAARRMMERIACPLLREDQICAIWKIRPSVCRGASSMEDPERCGPPARSVVRWGDLIAAFAGVRQGIADVLGAHGLDARPVELTLALHIALSDETAIARWAAGDHEVFAPAAISGGIGRAGSRHLPLLPSEAHP